MNRHPSSASTVASYRSITSAHASRPDALTSSRSRSTAYDCIRRPHRLLALAALAFACTAPASSALLAEPSAAVAAAATVSGRITDASSGDALSNAIISVSNTPIVAASDTEGYYLLQLPAGSYQFSVSYGGMDTLTKSVSVSAG